MAKYLVKQTIDYLVETILPLDEIKKMIDNDDISLWGEDDCDKYTVTETAHTENEYCIIEAQTPLDRIKLSMNNSIIQNTYIPDTKYYDKEGKIIPKYR